MDFYSTKSNLSSGSSYLCKLGLSLLDLAELQRSYCNEWIKTSMSPGGYDE